MPEEHGRGVSGGPGEGIWVFSFIFNLINYFCLRMWHRMRQWAQYVCYLEHLGGAQL